MSASKRNGRAAICRISRILWNAWQPDGSRSPTSPWPSRRSRSITPATGPLKRGRVVLLGRRLPPWSWPGLSRPSTSSFRHRSYKDVDARHKAGHDGNIYAAYTEDFGSGNTGAWVWMLVGHTTEMFSPAFCITTGVERSFCPDIDVPGR